MNLYFHPDAETELTDAAMYYANARPRLGESFIGAVERAAESIKGRPLIGALVADGNIRRVPIQRFPYSIIYRVLPDRVRVLAICHHKRQPRYWVGRQ